MNDERAHKINSALVQIGMMTILGFDSSAPDMDLLREVSLRDMLDAVAHVKLDDETRPSNSDGSRSFSIVPDDRLVAAVYTALHYSVAPNEGDDLVVGYPDGSRVHLLITAVRDRSQMMTVEQEDQAA
jgi:hypothetical protein